MKRSMSIACLGVLLLSGCGASVTPESNSSTTATEELQKTTVFAMDTVMELSAYCGDTNLMQQAQKLIEGLEDRLSVTDPNSEIATLNRNKTAQISADTAELLTDTLSYCDKTAGALDISVYPIVRAWGFTTDEYRIPSQDERTALLENVDYRQIYIDGMTASIEPDMEIDLGSVTKGYTGDKIEALFRQNGVKSGLLSLGGNIQAIGSKPDGSSWRVAVQHPESSDYLGVLTVSDKSVITSGGYERYFTGEDGTIYWHIIDPATGAPAKKGLISVTIVGETGAYCDALSTALFIKGLDGAIDFWREYQDFDAIFVTDSEEIYITKGIADSFTLADAFQDYKLTVVD